MKLWIANLDHTHSLDPEIPMEEFVQSLNAYNLQFLHFVVGGLLDRPCWNVWTPVAILLEKVGQKYGPLLPPLATALVAAVFQFPCLREAVSPSLSALLALQAPAQRGSAMAST